MFSRKLFLMHWQKTRIVELLYWLCIITLLSISFGHKNLKLSNQNIIETLEHF